MSSKYTIRLEREHALLLSGVSRTTLERAVADGLLTADGKNGKTDAFTIETVASWLEARREAERGGGEDSSKARKLHAEARLKELTVAEREGKLVDAEDVEARWLEMMSAVREAVSGIAATLVQANHVDPSDERKVEAIIRDALVNAKPPKGIDE